MPTSDSPLNADRLLDHARFVRFLASRLVDDPSAGEDLEQQTWLAALQSPPRRSDGARSWLRTVVGNFARKSHRERERRSRREIAAAKSESLPAVAEIVERETMLRSVVESVLDLDEPYRTCVLLRFYEDLPPRTIAKRLGIKVTTVQSRLQRGLEKLRGRLDKEHGDRARWAVALVGLTGIGRRSMAAGGVVAAAAALLLIVVAVAIWKPWSAEAGSPAVPDRPAGRSVAGSTEPAGPDPVTTAPFVEEPTARGAGDRFATMRVRVVDERRRPVAGANVSVETRRVSETTGVTDDRGRASVRVPLDHILDDPDLGIRVSADTESGVIAGLAQVHWRPQSGDVEHTVVARPGTADLEVVVLESGAPRPGAWVTIRAVGHRASALSQGSDVRVGRFAVDEDGSVLVSGLPAGRYAVRAHDQHRRGSHWLFLSAGEVGVAVVDLEPGMAVHTTIRDGREEPVVGARLTVAERDPDDTATRYVRDDAVRDPVATDEKGQTVVRRVDARTTSVLQLDGKPARRPDGSGARVGAGAGWVELRVPSTRRRSWPVRREGAPVPPDGDEVRVFVRTRSGLRRIAHGEMNRERFVVRDWPEDGIAGVTDWAGAEAVLALGGDASIPVVWRTAASLTVVVRSADGRGAAGLWCDLVDDGGRDGRRVRVPSDGRVRFDGLAPGKYSLALRPTSPITPIAPDTVPPIRRPLKRIDVEDDAETMVDGLIRRDVTFAVTIDDDARLPGDFKVAVFGAVWGPVVEDPVAATLSVPVWTRSGKKVSVTILSDVARHLGGMITIPDEPRPRVDVPLTTWSHLAIDVVPPADGWYALRVERRYRVGDDWQPAGTPRYVGKHRWRFDVRTDGQLRVFETHSGLVSHPVMVVPELGGSVRLDLSRTGWVEGELRSPTGELIPYGWIELMRPKRRISVRDGRFRVRMAWLPIEFRGFSRDRKRSSDLYKATAPERGVELILK